MEPERQNQLWWLDLFLLFTITVMAFLLYSQFASLKGWQDLLNIGFIYLFLGVFSISIVVLAGLRIAFFSAIGIASHQKILEDLALRMGRTKEMLLPFYLIGGMFVGFISTVTGNLLLKKILFSPKLPATLDTTTSGFTTIIVAPVYEEYARATFMPTMEKYLASQFMFGRTPIGITIGNSVAFLIAWVSQAALWSGWHFMARIRKPEELPALFFFGLVLGLLTRVTNNILPALGAHIVLNIVNQ